MKPISTYQPGSEWVYFRIYTGHRTADKILEDILYPSWQEINKERLSDIWFFIRFADPDFHLRFRIKLKKDTGSLDLAGKINHDLKKIDAGLIWKVELGTYLPEKERYGDESMKYAEQIFSADSMAFMKLLKSGLLRTEENARWLFAIASIDHLLDDFQCCITERKELLLELSRSFGREFGKDKHLAGQLSTKYRFHRQKINTLLSKGNESQILIPLRERSMNSAPAVKKILELYEKGKMGVGKEDLLSSFIHMSMNRIFQNNNRLHEMVVYDLLFRHYKSQLIISHL